MAGDVGRVFTERIYTLPAAGREGRPKQSEDEGKQFSLDEEVEEATPAPDQASHPDHAPDPPHGSVGHPDDDESGRRLDITG